MSLLSGLLVQGIRQGTSRAVSQALGQAVGSQLGSGFYTNLRPGSGASGASQQASVDRASQELGLSPNTVSQVEVSGAVPAPAPSALGQVLGGAGADALVGGAGGDTVAGVDVTAQQQQGGPSALAQALSIPTVEGLDVMGTRPPPPPSAEPATPLFSGAVPLTTMGQPEITPPPGAVETDESGDKSITAEQIAMMAPFAALGLVPTGSGMGTPTTANGINLPIKELIAGGLLAGGLAQGTGGLGSAGAGLKEIAQNSKNLANRLGDVAAAGMEGNIGGKGLNAIRRMVRKAQAAIRQRYAGMGMSGSSAETDDLNDAVEAGVEQQFKIGQDLAKTGLNAIAALTGQSAAAYAQLLNASTAKDTALGNALANFAGAIAR